MKPELELDDLIAKIPPINTENAAYAIGDHWQSGLGYSGPLLPADNPLYSTWVTEMERIFVFRDVLKEIRKRDRQALTGKAWTWAVVTAEGERVSGDEEKEVSSALREWIKKRNIADAVGDCIERTVWAGDEGQDARGVLRFYIRASEIDGDGYIAPETIEEALDLIQLESPGSEISTVYADISSNYRDVGVLNLQDEEDEEYVEIVYLEEASTKEESLTIIENLTEGDLVEARLRGDLTMYEVRRGLITDGAQRSMQKFLNHTLTAFQAAVGGAGWPEDFFFGLLPPGDWQEDASGNLTFQPDALARGPGRSHFLQSVLTTTMEGEDKAVGSSGHSRTNPVSPNLFVAGSESIRGHMLSQAFQEYTLLTGLAQASGEKLQIAKGDFEGSVSGFVRQVGAMASWVLRVAYALAENLLNTDPTGYDFNVDIQIDTGIVTIEQKLLLNQLVTERFISHKTALAEAGYPNPAAERQLIATEVEEEVELGLDADLAAGADVGEQVGGGEGSTVGESIGEGLGV